MAWLLSFGVLATRAIRVVPKFLLVGAPYLSGAATRLEGALVGRRAGFGFVRCGTPWLVLLATVLLSEHPVAHWFRPAGARRRSLLAPRSNSLSGSSDRASRAGASRAGT